MTSVFASFFALAASPPLYPRWDNAESVDVATPALFAMCPGRWDPSLSASSFASLLSRSSCSFLASVSRV